MTKRNVERAGTVLACALLTALSAASDRVNAQSVDAASNETPSKWFVQLASAPTADGGSLSATKADKTNFRKAAKAAGISLKERYSYDTLFNGISVEVAPSDL